MVDPTSKFFFLACFKFLIIGVNGIILGWFLFKHLIGMLRFCLYATFRDSRLLALKDRCVLAIL